MNVIEPPQIILKTPQDLKKLNLSEHRVWTIGRDPSNLIQISDRFASRFHAKLEVFETRHCCFYDLNSRNGSLYNGQPISGGILLAHGDRVTIGNAELLLKHNFITTHDPSEGLPTLQALMVHGSAVQGKIWQEILLSQDITVMWEIPGVDLQQLIGLRSAAHTLPHLLIIDIRAVSSEIFSFSRWCRSQQIKVQILLIDSRCTEVAKAERSLAKSKGFLDLCPAFSHRLLTRKSEIAQQVQLLMRSLGNTQFKYSELFRSLESLDPTLRKTSRLAADPSAGYDCADLNEEDLTALKADPRRKLKPA